MVDALLRGVRLARDVFALVVVACQALWVDAGWEQGEDEHGD